MRRALIGPAEDFVTDRQSGDAGSNGLDVSREIRALSEWKVHRIHILEVALANRHFAGIGSRGNDPHEHFARFELRRRLIDDVELIDSAIGDELHGFRHSALFPDERACPA